MTKHDAIRAIDNILKSYGKKEEGRMAIKRARTIAEYAFRKWMEQEQFQEGCFTLKMTDVHEAVIRDSNGDSMKLIYEPVTKSVFPICGGAN